MLAAVSGLAEVAVLAALVEEVAWALVAQNHDHHAVSCEQHRSSAARRPHPIALSESHRSPADHL